MNRPLSPLGHAMLTTFGLGTLRPAPGTWGSIPPVVLAAALLAAIRPEQERAWDWGLWLAYHAVLLVVFAVFCLACLVFGDLAEAHFGKKDPGSVCADETAGVCLPLMFVPAFAVDTPGRLAATMVACFLAFRLTDIVKAPPARGLQKIPGGLGVLIDDLVAGVQALVLVQAFVYLALRPG